MKFSIRLLLIVTLLAALLTKASLDKGKVAILQFQLEQERKTYRKLQARAGWLRKQNEVCEAVLANSADPSEFYFAAKERFDRLQPRKGEE